MTAAERRDSFAPCSRLSFWEMYRFYANEFISVSRELGRLIVVLGALPADEVRTKENLKSDLNGLAGDKTRFESLGLQMCVAQVNRMIAACKSTGEITQREMASMYEELANRMHDECELRYILSLTEESKVLFEPLEPLFGADVSARFPEAATDIDEAGKCLALYRGTACVMHLMRVVEVGLKALAKSLSIPYAPSWESYLKQISDKIALPYKKKSPKWRKNEAAFRDISGDLISVKQAWRNPTMHIVRHYTVEDAGAVFRAVRSFMQRLATELPV